VFCLTRYKPADSFETPRFSGVRTFMRLPHNRDLDNADAAIVKAPNKTLGSLLSTKATNMDDLLD